MAAGAAGCTAVAPLASDSGARSFPIVRERIDPQLGVGAFPVVAVGGFVRARGVQYRNPSRFKKVNTALIVPRGDGCMLEFRPPVNTKDHNGL